MHTSRKIRITIVVLPICRILQAVVLDDRYWRLLRLLPDCVCKQSTHCRAQIQALNLPFRTTNPYHNHTTNCYQPRVLCEDSLTISPHSVWGVHPYMSSTSSLFHRHIKSRLGKGITVGEPSLRRAILLGIEKQLNRQTYTKCWRTNMLAYYWLSLRHLP